VHAPARGGQRNGVLQSRATKCETVDGTAAPSTALCARDQPPSQQVHPHPPRPPLNLSTNPWHACSAAVRRPTQQRFIERVSQPCQAGSCGEQFLWRATEWGPCDSSCGRGVTKRLVECFRVASDGARPLLPRTWTCA
jgi:hypothetical protein